MSEATKIKILDLYKNHQIGTLATIQNQKPYSRFMLFFHENLTLYTATHKETHKVDELNKNPQVHILLGIQDAGFSGAYGEIEATASIEESNEKKEKFWNEKLSKWISSPEDPNYILLKLSPVNIRYFANSGSKAEEWTI